jgi:hypothetical protein
MLGQSPLLDEMMEKLQSKINRELKCLSIFLPLFLLFHFPLILLCSFVVCPPPVENERIELMIGCFESG